MLLFFYNCLVFFNTFSFENCKESSNEVLSQSNPIMANAPSPVLSTEQVFHTAGWVKIILKYMNCASN